MTKTAQLWKLEAQQGLDKIAVSSTALGSGSLDALKNYWDGLSAETKSTLVNSALGGALGGTAMGTMGAMSAPQGQGLGKGISMAALGTLLGSLAGGSGTMAYNAVSNGRQLPGEVKGHRAVGDTVASTVVGGMLKNPGLTAGTVGGGWLAGGGIKAMLSHINSFNKKELEAAAKTPAKTIDPLTFKNLIAGERGTAVRDLGLKLLGPSRNIAALPAGITLGYLIDKYIKGDYE